MTRRDGAPRAAPWAASPDSTLRRTPAPRHAGCARTAERGERTMYSRIKLAGHPLHPMVVAYPIALYTWTLVSYLIYLFGGDPFWFKVAVVTNIAGVIMAVVAAVPGFLDWALGVPAGSAAKRHGQTHLALNVVALLLFLINAVVHVGQFSDASPDRAWGFILALVGVGCTVAAGFFGWTMIQNDHVGIELTPAQARLEPLATMPEAGDRPLATG
jgi:uncharacterized membrane protein